MPKSSKSRRSHHVSEDYQQSRPTLWRAFFGVTLVVLAVLAVWYGPTLLNLGYSMPICPDCDPSSQLRETLEKLDPLWAEPPQEAEEIISEMEILADVQKLPRSGSSTIAEQEVACLEILIERFDERLDQYAHSVIERLVGFGPDEACPKLQELTSLAERFQPLMKLSSKETPKCKEFIDWHWRHYSCAPRQP